MARRTAARARRAVALAGVVLTAGALAGCGSAGGYQSDGPWRPLPDGPPPQVGPPADPAVPPPRAPAVPGSGEQEGDPNVVAADLVVPTGLAVLPDGSAVVGERETGRLLQVFPDRAPPRELMTVAGIDTSGDGGLLGLAVSPTFAEDGLVYAYVSTSEDNRVVRFPIGGTPNAVLTGIPRGEEHNGGGLWFAPDGSLFVGTGDTGEPALAADPASLAGKVLHVDVFGRPADDADGAADGTPVHSSGHVDVAALCSAGPEEPLYAVGGSELNRITPGSDHGWPVAGPGTVDPVVEFVADEAGLGGCAVTGGTIFVGSLTGERIHIVNVDEEGARTGDVERALEGLYGRLRTLVLDAEGGLWVTTSNRDDVGDPAEDDDRVLRIVAPTAGGNSPL